MLARNASSRNLDAVELDMLRKTVARLDNDCDRFQALLREERERSAQREEERARLVNELRVAASEISDLQESNRVLLRKNGLRQKQVEELTGTLERRGAESEDKIRALRDAARAREDELATARSTSKLFMSLAKEKEREAGRLAVKISPEKLDNGEWLTRESAERQQHNTDVGDRRLTTPGRARNRRSSKGAAGGANWAAATRDGSESQSQSQSQSPSRSGSRPTSRTVSLSSRYPGSGADATSHPRPVVSRYSQRSTPAQMRSVVDASSLLRSATPK